MSTKSYIVLCITIGILLAWVLGYLRLPFLENTISNFWLGCITGVGILSLIFLSVRLYNQKSYAGDDGPEHKLKNEPKDNTLTWVLIISILSLAGILCCFLLLKENQDLKENRSRQQSVIQKLSENLVSSTNNNLVPLMANLLQEVKVELKNKPEELLKENTIARIAALSHSFKPYQYWQEDSLSLQKYSPERAQLLMAIVNMGIHTNALHQIIQKTSFEAADLGGLDLSGLDLKDINLKGANLKNVDFSRTNLNRANLSETNLWGSKLNHTDLSKSNLKQANLSWAEVNQAIFNQVNLEKAILSNAKLKNAKLQKASLKWADADGTLFQEADLTEANLTGAMLSKANLRKVKLQNGILTLAKLEDTDLREASLDNVTVFDKNWLEKLSESRVIGMESIQANYKVVEDPPGNFTIRIKE